MVNYDPVDKTVLANEQVDVNGFSWRSGAKVDKRLLKQWFLKITEFREALLKDLDYLAKDGAWPERVLSMQKNWLGKSAGAQIQFTTTGEVQQTGIEVFTTRPDTLFGVQYIALASDHPIVQELAKTDAELRAFLATMPTLPVDSKAGYLLHGVEAINPISEDESAPDSVKTPLPIYVAPYVLGDYGNGAVMGVPGHDVRDHAFWKHNRRDDLITTVVSPFSNGSVAKIQPFVREGYLTSQSGRFVGQTTADATKIIIQSLESKKKGSPAETWRLRDWLISRQRYWGTPIPIIHCDSCGAVPVPENELPVELPCVEDHWAEGKTGNPLAGAHDWINTSCPRCHGPAKRDTDTMDTFVDSSWYFMRFLDPKNEYMPLSSSIADEFLPVDVYIGGVEHAILHLLYARFISKFIATTDLWESKNCGEPFKKVLTQGMVHGKTYSDPSNGRFLKPDEVDLTVPSAPVVVATREAANISFEKMSKSKYNGVDPGACMEKYGADSTRAHILFQAPVSEVLEWDEEKISGITRWLKRLHEFIDARRFLWHKLDDRGYIGMRDHFLSNAEGLQKRTKEQQLQERWVVYDKYHAAEKKLWQTVQSTISSVSESYGKTFSLNTVVSDLMGLTNAVIEAEKDLSTDSASAIIKQATQKLIQMMAPITPAFSEECWRLLHPGIAEFKWGTKPQGILDFILSKVYPMPPDTRSPTGHLSYVAPQLSIGYRLIESKVGSIFDFPFPEPDGTLEMLGSNVLTCAVQINGKMKFVVEIEVPPSELEGPELEKWLVEQISKTEEGKRKLKGKLDGKLRKVIVVKRGKTVNFVFYIPIV